jgi:AcrR family transcriptional regulator
MDSKKKKRGYHHGDLKNALVQAALAQIAVSGVHSLSLREVARSTGVSHAAAYRHFRNKEDMLAAIAEQGFVILGHALQAAIEQHSGNSLAAFKASGIAYVEFGIGHPEHLQVMFGGALNGFAQWPSLQKAGQHAYDLLKTSARKALHTGEISGDESTIALAAWSLVHGLTQLIVGGQIPHAKQSPRHLAQTVIALLTQGLRANV